MTSPRIPTNWLFMAASMVVLATTMAAEPGKTMGKPLIDRQRPQAISAPVYRVSVAYETRDRTPLRFEDAPPPKALIALPKNR